MTRKICGIKNPSGFKSNNPHHIIHPGINLKGLHFEEGMLLCIF